MDNKQLYERPTIEDMDGWRHPVAVPITLKEVLTLQDQFAMAALPALISLHRSELPWSRVAKTAYAIAANMMEARK